MTERNKSRYARRMGRLVRIDDTVNGTVLPPSQVFAVLPAKVEALHWRVLDLGEVVPVDGREQELAEIERRVHTAPGGLPLRYQDLLSIAASMRQLIDGLFVAASARERLPVRGDDDATILKQCEIVLAAIDSSFWLLKAEDDLLERVRDAFAALHEVAPEAVSLSTWARES
jgi:hypothetical protein